VHVVHQLRVLVDIPPPGGDIGLKVGDAVDDGHDKLPVKLKPELSLAWRNAPPNMLILLDIIAELYSPLWRRYAFMKNAAQQTLRHNGGQDDTAA
jgi:hypothetical protein